MCDTPESTKTAIHELRHRIEKVESKLDGNGRPGIVERLAALERAQNTQTWLLRLIVGGVLTQLCATAFIFLRKGI